jgi:hypothetical protein
MISLSRFRMEFDAIKQSKLNEITSQIESFASGFGRTHPREINNIDDSISDFARQFYKTKESSFKEIKYQIREFKQHFGSVYAKERKKLLKGLNPYISRVNYLSVFGIARQEETYTKFLEWLFNPADSHGLKEKPLSLFMDKIVGAPYKLSGTKVKAEEQKEGERLDLLIRNKEFLCVIELKISSRQGRNQLKRYYERWHKESMQAGICDYYIYLTLTGEKGNSLTKFKSVTWNDMIQKVLLPITNYAEEPAKDVIQSVIHSLLINQLPDHKSLFIQKEYAISDLVKLNNIIQKSK